LRSAKYLLEAYDFSSWEPGAISAVCFQRPSAPIFLMTLELMLGVASPIKHEIIQS